VLLVIFFSVSCCSCSHRYTFRGLFHLPSTS